MSTAEEAVAPAPIVTRPWPGLDAFTSDYRFCGREEDIAELIRRLKRGVGTVLYGQSGLGKTSLLQAGIAPVLVRTQHLPIIVRLIHKSDAPPLIEQMRAEIQEAVAAASLFEPTVPAPGEDLWRYLHRRDVSWLLKDGNMARPVLIFDQFEEIFTNGQSSPELARRSKEFFNELADLVQGRRSAAVEAELAANPEAAKALKQDRHDYHVLLAIREDYLPHLDTAVDRFEAPDFVSNRHRLLPFNGTNALAAVEGPGEGLLAPGVGESIVRKVAAAKQRHLSVTFLGEDDQSPLDLPDLRVEPALLSLMCSRLNEARLAAQEKSGHAELITADLVKEMGGQVLDDFYRQALAALPARAQGPMATFIQEKLISESGQYRQQVVFDSAEKHLTDRGISRAVASECFEILVRKQRLLRMEDRGDVRRIELTHDVLCSVVARGRDEDRARSQRVQHWKNVATIAAAVFFLCAVVLGIFAAKKATLADRHARDADRARSDAAAQAMAAMDARQEAKRKLGNWYEQRIGQAASEKDLASAALIRANGAVKAEMPAPQAIGYIAPPPRLQPLGRIKLAAPPAKYAPVKSLGIEGVARVQWLNTRRSLFALTTERHLCVVPDLSQPPAWLVAIEAGLSLAAQGSRPGQEARRVEINCAIAWVDENGVEGILAGLKGGGACFVPVTGSDAPAARLAKDAGDVTALVQSPDTGVTWAGLANGLVMPLEKDARSASLDAPFLCTPREPEIFAPERAWRSPRGRWLYVPISHDTARDLGNREDEARRANRCGLQPIDAAWDLGGRPSRSRRVDRCDARVVTRAAGNRQWALVEVDKDFQMPNSNASWDDLDIDADRVVTSRSLGQVGTALPVPAGFTDARPTNLVFSPDDRYCFVQTEASKASKGAGTTWTRITLPSGKPPPSPRKSTGINPGEARTSEKVAGGGQQPPAHEKDLDTLPLANSNGSTALIFIDDDCFVTATGLKLDAYSAADPNKHSSTVLEAMIRDPGPGGNGVVGFSGLKAAGGGGPVLALFMDTDSNFVGFRALRRDATAAVPKLALIASAQMHSPTPVAPALLRDGSGAFWEETAEVASANDQKPAGTAPTSTRTIYWLNLVDGAKAVPFPWRERAAQLPLNRVGGVAFDAQGGVLCASAESGVGCLDAKTGQLLNDHFLRNANPQPETLLSRPEANEFTVQADATQTWRIHIEPYAPAKGPVRAGDIVVNQYADPPFGSGTDVTSGARHPDGSTSVVAVNGSSGLENALRLKSGDTDVIEQLWLSGRPMTALGFSADGLLLAGGNDKGDLGWWSLDLDQHPRATIYPKSGDAATVSQIAANGRGAFVLADGTGLHRWTPHTGEIEPLPLPKDTRRVLAVAAAGAPGGAVTVLAETTDHRLVVCVAETAAEIAAAPLSASPHFNQPPELPFYAKWHTVTGAVLAPDGAAFLLSDPNGVVELWRRDGARLLPVVLPDEIKAAGAEFDTKGRVLLYSAGGKSYLVSWGGHDAPPQIASTPSTILAAAYVPALDRFLVSFEKTGLALVDPAHFQDVAADETAESAAAPTQILVSPDGSFAVVSSENGVELYDPRESRRLGPLAHATSDAFADGGCISSGNEPQIIGLAPGLACAWRPSDPWSPEIATLRTAEQIDDNLNTTRVNLPGEVLGLPRGVPAPDRALAQAWRLLNRLRLNVLAGGPPAPGEGPDLAPAPAALPSGARSEFAQWSRLSRPVGGARDAAAFLAAIDRGVGVDVAADQPIPPVGTWPAAFRGDFIRAVTLGQWNRLLASDDAKGVLTPDQEDFLPEYRERIASYVETLDQAWNVGAMRVFAAPRVQAALVDIAAALNQKHVDPTGELSKSAVRQNRRAIFALQPRDVSLWNLLGDTTSQVPVEGASARKDQNGLTARDASLIRIFQRATGLAEDPANTDKTAADFARASWANFLESPPGELPKAERETWRQAALGLAREVIVDNGTSDPKEKLIKLSAWTTLRDFSKDDEERLRAAQNVIELAESGDPAQRTEALRSLANIYRSQYSLEGVFLLEKAVTISAKDGRPTSVYDLTILGERLRIFGGTFEECQEIESAAENMESSAIAKLKKEADDAEHSKDTARFDKAKAQLTAAQNSRSWLSRDYQAHTMLMHGDPAATEALLKEGWDIAREEKSPSPWILGDLGVAALDLRDLQTAGSVLAAIRESKWTDPADQWNILADIARAWIFRFPDDPRGREIAGEILKENTGALMEENWRATALALDATGGTDAALQLIARMLEHQEQKPPQEVNDRLLTTVQINSAKIAAIKKPDEALWHLAEAVGRGWQDSRVIFNFDPALAEGLKDQPLYQQLRTTLSFPLGDHRRYLGMARFIQGAIANWRAHGGQVAPEAEAPLVANPLLQATILGLDPDPLVAPGGEFAVVALWKEWPDKRDAARAEAVDLVRDEAEALAAAWSQSWKEMQTERNPDALLRKVLPHVIVHGLLKRAHGLDPFGHPFHLDPLAHTVSISPQTRQLVAAWKDVDDDFWTIKVEPPKVDDKPPAPSP